MIEPELKAAITVLCKVARAKGQNVIVAVLDEEQEGLAVLSSYDAKGQSETMQALHAITEIYLSEGTDGTSEERPHLIC